MCTLDKTARISLIAALLVAVASGGCGRDGAVEERRREDVSVRGMPEPEPVEPEMDSPEAPPRLPGPDEWFFGPPDPEVPAPWASGCDTPWPMPGCPTAREQDRIPGYEGGVSS